MAPKLRKKAQIQPGHPARADAKAPDTPCVRGLLLLLVPYLTALERLFNILNMRSADLTATARIRDAAIEQFGQHGFGVGLRTIAEAAGVSAALVIHHFGSKEGLRKACDDYVADEIRNSKSEAMQSRDPTNWLGQLAEIESYAPLTAYLVRSLQTGGELAMTMWHTMIANAESYFAEGVQAGTIKPSRDPHARARYLAITSGGGLLLYLQMHDNPTDLRAVLRDYASEMVLPALEIYTEGLMADRTMYDAFVAADEAADDQGGSHVS
jgi:AcrR family transcriptional regulator